MAAKFIAVAFLVAAAQGSTPVQTSFSYGVSDPHTGDVKNQHETRIGDSIVGQYSLHESDGTKRTVDYSADAHNGFNAVVRKDPLYAHATPVVANVAPIVANAYAALILARGYAGAYAAPLAYEYSNGYGAPLAGGYTSGYAGGYAGYAAPIATGYSNGYGAPLVRGYANGYAAPIATGYSNGLTSYDVIATPYTNGAHGSRGHYGSNLY